MNKVRLGMLLLSLSGCAHTSLDETYGLIYHTVFAAQLADRPTREPVTRGEEARRIITAHYEALAAESDGSAAASAPTSSRNSSGAPQPFRIGPR